MEKKLCTESRPKNLIQALKAIIRQILKKLSLHNMSLAQGSEVFELTIKNA